MIPIRFPLITCAAACLALPGLALAQTPPPQGGPGAQGGDQEQTRMHRNAERGVEQGRAQQRRLETERQGRAGMTGAPPTTGAPGTRHLQTGPGAAPHYQRAPAGGAPGAVERRNHNVRPGATVVPPPPFVTQPAQPPRSGVAPRPELQTRMPPLGGWNRNLKGPERNRAGEQWRRQHQGWDRDAAWKHNRNWWRHDRRWRQYSGFRFGFFFLPSYGYINVPSMYRTRYWRAGEYLPAWYWRYVVRDYWAYGLPPPPPGCAWVWVNRDIALIDLGDGYILDFARNVW